jgi:hypothetical protein
MKLSLRYCQMVLFCYTHIYITRFKDIWKSLHNHLTIDQPILVNNNNQPEWAITSVVGSERSVRSTRSENLGR